MTYSKIITLDDHFATGEPTVQLVSTWGRNGRLLRESTSLHKVASTRSPAMDYIKTVEPEPGKTIVLVVGLGDDETYGANRNGDGFPSQPVRGKIAADEVLTKHYKSYENAHVFEHHVNNNPAKAIGRVKKAFWNPAMRRVEVVEDFINDKAPHLLEKIASGEFPSKSMGCFPAGTEIRTPEGFKEIQDVKLGDLVLTHKGNWKRVTELHPRQYAGTFYTFHTVLGDVTATQEHPVEVIRAVDVMEWVKSKGYNRRKTADCLSLDLAKWIPAESAQPDDFLITPFDATIRETLTEDECRLLGYYAAEGTLVNGTSQGFSLTVNINDAAVSEVPALIKRLDPAVNVNVVPHPESDQALNINVYSKFSYELCNKHVGKTASQKRLSLELLQQPRAQQLAFLGAYINGDGGNTKTGDFYISSCNKALVYQLQLMGFRCGLYSRVTETLHKPSTVVAKETVEFRTCFSRRYCNIIAPYTTKVKPRKMKSGSTGPFFLGNAVVSKIRDITVDIASCAVFNFEVEDDNSYVANNHAVHNCKIKYDVCKNCGNRARTRAEYCDHLKYAMSRIDPDTGVQNTALNPSPDFFDSSWVKRPADRTGYMLKKVAHTPYDIRLGSYELSEIVNDLSRKAAEFGKAADIEKVIGGEPTTSVSNLDADDSRLVERYMKGSAKKDKPDHSQQISIMISYKPSEALSSADDAGLPLGIKDLMQFFLGKVAPELGEIDKPTLKSASDHLGLIYSIFSQYPRFYNELVKEAGLETRAPANPELTQKLALFDGVTGDYLRRKLLPEYLAPQRPNTDMLTWTDPNTGNQYQTNYGTVRKTNDPLIEQGLKQQALTSGALLGTGALLGGAAYAARNTRIPKPLRYGAGLVGAGLGYLGARNATKPTPIAGPKVLTDQGETISGWTEMVPQNKLGEFSLTNFSYVMDRAAEAPSPVKAAHIDHFMDQLKNAEVHDELSPLIGPNLDLDKVAQALGSSILMRTGQSLYW